MDKGVRPSSRLSLVLLDPRVYMAAAAAAAAAVAMVAAAAVAVTEVHLLVLVAVPLLARARALAMVAPLAATGPQLSPGVRAQLATPIHTQTLPTQALFEATTSLLSGASSLLMVCNGM